MGMPDQKRRKFLRGSTACKSKSKSKSNITARGSELVPIHITE
jgi:hypothetical protein